MTRREKFLVIVILLLAAMVFVSSVVSGQRRERAERAERQAEAVELERDGLLVGREETRRGILKSLEEQAELREQVQKAREIADATPRTVTRWKTKEIKVPVEKIIRVKPATITLPCPDEGEFDCADCLAVLPAPTLRVGVVEATLETRLGNPVLVGSAQIWRVDPDELGAQHALIGYAEIDADASEFLSLREKPILRNELRFGFTTGPGFEGVYSRLLTKRRLTAYAGVSWEFDPLTTYAYTHQRSRSERALEASAGLGWRF